MGRDEVDMNGDSSRPMINELTTESPTELLPPPPIPPPTQPVVKGKQEILIVLSSLFS